MLRLPPDAPALISGAQVQSTTHVAIVLGTLNGAAYLPDQLASLLAQTHEDWSLWVHDDGSTDGTWAILQDFAQTAGHRGKPVMLARSQAGGGVAAAYHWLLTGPGAALAPYTALCDQDDIWAPDRLARGVAGLAGVDPAAEAVLHTAAMELIDGQGHPLGLSRPRRGTPPPPSDFASTLARCPTNAPTLLMTQAAARLLRDTPLPPGLPSHDWWLVSLTLGCGGRLVRDAAETVRYRQHAGNALGEAGTWRGTGKRLSMLLNGAYRHWRGAIIAGLHDAPLTAQARATVAAYENAPLAGPRRARALRACGITRPGRAGGIATALGACLGRL